MKILVINAGSSSHKLALFDFNQSNTPLKPIWKGMIEWGRVNEPFNLSVETQQQTRDWQLAQTYQEDQALELLLASLWTDNTRVIEGPQAIQMVGHRVVHGGSYFQPTLITSQVEKQLEDLASLAPLHNEANLRGVQWMLKRLPGIPNIAVFDTAFHRTMPEVAKTYPLPYEWREQGIQRYGFHGISHHYCADYISTHWPDDSGKIINCHLGNGASLCAIQNQQSVNTTMGFTPLEGLMMGTRSGSIDPGIIFYLLKEKRFDPALLDKILNFESGLKGIAQTSDMREILRFDLPEKRLAFDMYVYHLKGFIGALAAQMGEIEMLSFTGGIGENVPLLRQKACEGLAFMGVKVDESSNAANSAGQLISAADSKVKVCVIHTQEEWMIAKQCWQWHVDSPIQHN